jgi:MFS family permease
MHSERQDATMQTIDTKSVESSPRKVATASFIGTLIEFYDFLIYATAAALVFPKVFFPALGPAAGTIASFASFGVAFLARPVGAVLFGHVGDRFGRKKSLIATLLIMGVATILIGLLPTANQIGVLAPLLLVALRIVQGLAAGGEWAGAVMFSAEHSPKATRGFWAMFPIFGSAAANILVPATFLVVGLSLTDEQFLTFGWRIPFIASILLVGVGLWIRTRVDESPVFKEEVAKHGTVKIPFVEAIKNQHKEILLAAGAALTGFTTVYLGASYLINYGTSVLGLSRTPVLIWSMISGLTLMIAIFISAKLSDRLGRRRVMMSASGLGLVWVLALFPLIDSESLVIFGFGVIFTTFIAGLCYGPLGALMSELFETRYRATAAGISYSLAGIVGGAIPPLVGAAVVPAHGGLVFGLFLALLCLLGVVSLFFVRETRGTDLRSATSTTRDETSKRPVA